ncbi:MAG: TonB-dependent receptor [Pyrinomonadaceae bacterium]
MMNTKMFIRILLAAVITAIALNASIFAQNQTTGAIGGKVVDPQGAVIPNAAVTITNLGTNKVATVMTSGDGEYRVTNLEPGTYSVEATSGNFAPAKAESVIVEVGRETSLDLSMSVTGTSAQVDVTAEAPVINTNDNANATNIDQTQISELPINGRRASDFARLTPGVNAEGDFGLNSFRGLSSLLNNHTLDGTDNNNMFFSEERGRTRIQYSVSQAAVREFQVNNTNFSAEYGRAAGGVINTVTKSGTNEFRGELFIFDRDNRFGARNPSALLPTPTGLIAVKPKDVRYQFGGAVGGPIIKNKLFFFFNYDQQKRNFPGVATPQIPTAFNPITVATNGACNNSNTAGNTLCTRGITQSQADASLNFLRSLTGTAPRRQDQKIIFPKIDWNINDSNTLTVSYNRVRTNGLNAFQTPTVVNVGAADFGDDFVNIDTFNVRLMTNISSTIINEFRFQRGRENARSILQNPSAAEVALAGSGTTINGLLPSVSFATAANVGFQFGTSTNFQRAAFPDERTTQFVDTITTIMGNHSLKAGFDIKFTKDVISNLRSEYGSYSYNNLQDFITDYTSAVNGLGPRCVTGTPPRNISCYSSFQQAFGLRDYTLNTPDYGFFVQDDWRINRRVTLNLGLRYDYQKFPDPQFPNTVTPTLNTLTATIPQRYTQAEANAIIARTGQFPSDKNNFGPRIGVAWDIFGDGKTVLRGGYGIYYGRVPNTFLSSAVTNTGGEGSQLAATSITPTTTGLVDVGGNPILPPTFPSVLSATPRRSSAALSITTIAPNFENPRVTEIDIIFERQVAKNTVFSVSYLFTAANKLPAFIDLNLPPPTSSKTYTIVGGPRDQTSFTVPYFLSYGNTSTTTRPITNFASIIDMESVSKSRYNALVLQIQRRMTNGWSIQANYTRSKAIDYGQQFATFAASFMTVSDPFDLSYDKSYSGNNIPHKFVASGVWRPAEFFNMAKTGVARAIFGDLQVSPIFVISSGYSLQATIPTTFPPGFSTPSNTLFGAGGVIGIPFLRNVYRRPYTTTTDLRISKRIRFNEHMRLELLAEGFNIFNRSNVTGVNTTYISNINFTTGVLTYNPSFGSTTTINNSTTLAPRQIQLGAKFLF